MPFPSNPHHLPWQPDTTPLMLAPMQGLTNRGLRHLFAQWGKPDTLFTEFMRVAPGETNKRLSAVDQREIAATEQGIPLVVQLIGSGTEALIGAAQTAQDAGAAHINLNLGCPYGRMTSGLTGAGMLQQPELLQELVPALREAIRGSFSIKLRAGYNDPQQIFSLLPLFESSKVDFLVLHPRTVLQEYEGFADHTITTRVVQETNLPVIANGDIRTVEDRRNRSDAGTRGDCRSVVVSTAAWCHFSTTGSGRTGRHAASLSGWIVGQLPLPLLW